MNGLNNSYAAIVEELVNLDEEGHEAYILVGAVATVGAATADAGVVATVGAVATAGAAIADAGAVATGVDLNLVRRSSLYFWHSYWHLYCQWWYQPCYWRYPR